MDVDSSPPDLAELRRWVLSRNRRIELTARDGEACVLISKAELDALETALEILSNTPEVRMMRDQLARLGSLGSAVV